MRIVIVWLICLSLTPSASAVGTAHWTHTSESDFNAGTLKDVVATNLGDLKLSRAVRTLLSQDARVSAVYAMAQTENGAVYVGTGPQGLLLRVEKDQINTEAELGQHVNLFSLLTDSQGRLLVGTGGLKGQIFRINKSGEKPQAIFEADGVQYVWAMVETNDGSIYAATGPEGQLFQIDPDGSSKVLFDSDENNLLCLISDGGDFLYAGTDPNGLVYRINRRSGEVFVVYDAAESEISALVRDAKGNIYAATAQAIETDSLVGEELAEQAGRPESDPRGLPLPSERPPAPEPPEMPDPAPGEPLPIPRQIEPKSMVIRSQVEDDPGDAPVPPPREPDERAAPEHDLEAAARLSQQAVGVISAEPIPEGNAIYRIDRDGFVTEVFRQNVIVYCMIENNGILLVGTGADGQIYQIDPSAEETLVLANVDSSDVLSILPSRTGNILLGLANSGEIASMTSGFAPQGVYTSPVLDAGQISRFGKIRLRGTLPDGTSLHVSTRSGNVAGTSGAGWAPWSQEISAAEFVQIPSPPARFLQYRLRFSSPDGTQSPAVEQVDVAYQLPNLAPRIATVVVEPGEVSRLTSIASPESSKYAISWETTDPNEDQLVYRMYFRSGTRGPWILLKDKLTDASFEWETRTVADGVYQVKIEASDAPSNPLGTGRTASRVSDPVLVDNTPPAIGDLRATVRGPDARIEFNAVDRSGTIAAAAYAVNSGDDWQAVLPSDNIADSPQETYSFTVPGLPAGSHQIMLRVVDQRGNAAFESVTVTMEK